MSQQRKPARPPDYDPGRYPRFAVTVDVIVFTLHESALHVLLVERGEQPFRGSWALPGGFKRPTESLEEAALRELVEETSVTPNIPPMQFRAYGDPDRDPRMNVVTVAFVSVVPKVGSLRSGTDAAAAQLHPVKDVLLNDFSLAFDHRKIVTDAVEFLRRQLEISDLATRFFESPFTLSELRSVYDAVWNTRLEPANFRRSLLADEKWLVATGEIRRSGAAGGKPAELYRPAKAWRSGGPVRRPG